MGTAMLAESDLVRDSKEITLNIVFQVRDKVAKIGKFMRAVQKKPQRKLELS